MFEFDETLNWNLKPDPRPKAERSIWDIEEEAQWASGTRALARLNKTWNLKPETKLMPIASFLLNDLKI